jgi:sRNA-binding protein
VGREELMRFFAQFANTAEELILGQAKIETAIETKTREDIERPMEDVVFRTRVINLRTQVSDGLKKQSSESKVDWFGPFDGWFKQYVEESYGKASEFAKEHGADEDWAGRMIYIVLPSQVTKHNVLATWAEFAGMALVETKTGFKPIYDAVVKKLAEGEPKRGTKDMATHLEERARYDGEVRNIKRSRKEVEEWLAGKRSDASDHDAGAKPGADKPRNEKEELTESINEDRAEVAKRREELAVKATTGNLDDIAGIMGVVKELEGRIKTATERLAELAGPASPTVDGVNRIANILVDEPGAPDGMPGAIHVAPTQRDDKPLPATIEEIMAEITQKEGEFKQIDDAITRRNEDIRVFTEQADNLRGQGKRGDAARKDIEAGKLEETNTRAKEAAQKIQQRIELLTAEKAKLETPPAAPAAATKPEKKRDRRRKPTAATPPTVAPAAVTTNGSDAEHATTTLTKKSLIEEIKAVKGAIGLETADALVARIIKGEALETVKEDLILITN